jgi:Zn-dependent M28 family amino/carboxypeptidase
VETTREYAHNVIAIAEGRDPQLKNEYVVVGAHLDHVGMGTPRQPGEDVIFNGADDDGSGTVALMEMAEALAQGPRPKRSVLFIWHVGEEKGLWGSRLFTEKPTVPLQNIIAQVNIDMIGRSRLPGDPQNPDLSEPDEIYVIGPRLASPDLGKVLEQVNNQYLRLRLNPRYDDPNDPERLYYRSDHISYASKGIPVIFFLQRAACRLSSSQRPCGAYRLREDGEGYAHHFRAGMDAGGAARAPRPPERDPTRANPVQLNDSDMSDPSDLKVSWEQAAQALQAALEKLHVPFDAQAFRLERRSGA